MKRTTSVKKFNNFDMVKSILNLFKQTSKIYVNPAQPAFVEYYTDIWEYKNVKIETICNGDCMCRNIYKNNILIHFIPNVYACTPTTLAYMLQPLIQEYLKVGGE